MKQSVGLVVLQIFGIIVSLISIFWIAGSLPPELYAILGVYGIISTLIVVFSNTGLEMYAIRNVLSWVDNNDYADIKLVVSQSVLLRVVASLVVILPVILYSKYISVAKFNGEYFYLFTVMAFLSVGKAANDSMILILRSFNRYLSASFISYAVNGFGRLAALFVYIKFGFTSYIYTLLILPIIITIPVIYMLKEWFTLENLFSVNKFKENLISSKEFAYSSYISYGYNQVDQLLVSVFLNPEILGTFTLVKSIMNMGKMFIENIFDPIIQGLVKFKENMEVLKTKLIRINKLKNGLFITSIALFPIIFFYLDFAISKIGIDDYIYIKPFIILAYFSQVMYLAVKLKTTSISLFYPQKYFLHLTLFRSVVSIVLFVVVILINSRFLYSHILIMNMLLYFYANRIVKNNKPLFE